MARRREPDAPKLPTCDRLWTTPEVAAYLGVPVTTLHQWRSGRIGPDAFRVGRHLRYDPDVVKRWLVEQCQQDRSA
jgi:excisionase family DNA binding protein